MEENELTVTITRLLWELDLCCKFMWTDKSNDKNKTILLHSLLPPFSVFLIAENLLKLWFWIFRFSARFYELFCGKLSVIAWVDNFVFQICWKWVEKELSLGFNPRPNKNQLKYSHNKC